VKASALTTSDFKSSCLAASTELNLRTEPLERNRRCSAHLIDQIDGVIFTANMGDVIQPCSTTENMCDGWSSVPHNSCYLTATIPCLKILSSRNGLRENCERLGEKLRWHSQVDPFHPCQHRGHFSTCARIQQLVCISRVPLLMSECNIRRPGCLSERGAVVFGSRVKTAKQKPVSQLPTQPWVCHGCQDGEDPGESAATTPAKLYVHPNHQVHDSETLNGDYLSGSDEIDIGIFEPALTRIP
jgi:hypothetical protein